MKISFFKIVFALVFFLSPFVVLAGSEHNLSGYAWSSNIGWISFNNTNTGGGVNYGVHKSSTGANVGYLCGNETCSVPGYAWSSNIGWIQFGGLSGFPTNNGTTVTGTTASNAKIVGTSLVGWAKALSADGNGWDGWISLTGSNYGVTQSDTNFASFAWGSDVMGWIDFQYVTLLPANALAVTTSDVTSIAQTTATSGGTITLNEGETVVKRGIVWNLMTNLTDPLPTTAVNIGKTATDGAWGTNVPWSDNMTGLASGATYRVRAYVASNIGTTYGNSVTFTTTGGSGTCSDGFRNGDETGIDIGGRCGGGGGGTSYTLGVDVGAGTGTGTVTTINPTTSVQVAGVDCTTGIEDDCSETYAAEASVTLDATPAYGSSFASGWSGEGCSGTGNCTVTMDADKFVTANFGRPDDPLCPATGNDVKLVKSNLNVNETTEAIIPIGYSGGSLYSDNRKVATVVWDIPGAKWVVTARGSGQTLIHGSDWTAPNDAFPCSLNGGVLFPKGVSVNVRKVPIFIED